MLTPLGRLLPPESPEKWKTVHAALESTAKTLRLCLILLVASVPVALMLVLVIIGTWHIQW